MTDQDFQIERLILTIGNRLAADRTEDLKEFNLTPFQSETLLFYEAHPGSNIRELKERLQISHQAARNLVDRVREKGLLRLEASPEDRRAKCVFLTPEGEAICRSLQARGGEVGRDLLIDLTDDEKETLLTLLRKIRQ